MTLQMYYRRQAYATHLSNGLYPLYRDVDPPAAGTIAPLHSGVSRGTATICQCHIPAVGGIAVACIEYFNPFYMLHTVETVTLHPYDLYI